MNMNSASEVQAVIPVFRPSHDEEDVRAVAECLLKGWTGCGPKVKEFEEKFAEYIGVPYAVATNSCTASLHMALRVLELEGAEVISTPMTFISTNHAILYNKAVPVFADIQPGTLNIDPESIRQRISKKTRAIMIVHYGGQSCELDKIREIAAENKLHIVEDVAHGCGGAWDGQKLGSFGELACFSFHAVKNLAIGDGGMIVTRDKKIYERLLKLRWVGISRDTWDRSRKGSYSWDYNIEELGFKYHMNDISAAIGLVQLGRLDSLNERRKQLALRYRAALKRVPQIQLLDIHPRAQSAWHNFVVLAERRDELMMFLRERSISTGVHYRPNNHYALYRDMRGETTVAEALWPRLLTLPLFPDLQEVQQDYILHSIKAFYLI